MTETKVATEYTGSAIAAMVAVPILILILIIGAIVALRLRRGERNGPYSDRGLYLGIAITCVAAAVVAAVGLWWGMYPWKAEYHEWRPISGTVAKVDSRLMSTGAGDGSMEDKFVVTFEGNPQRYGILDTRAASVEPGDSLTITCVRRWQWSGTHGHDCNFVELVPGGSS